MDASHHEAERVLNPYASFLGDNDPFHVIVTTPRTLAAIVGRTSEERLNRSPAPGKWSIREILCHLADCELVFGFRLRQTVAEASHVIQPFDQEAWQTPYGSLSAQDALAAFTAARRWNLLFADAVLPGALPKPVIHPERGPMTFGTIIETMAGHDLNHLAQIQALA
jgi:uncharacterized damage-inducible protein DinB